MFTHPARAALLLVVLIVGACAANGHGGRSAGAECSGDGCQGQIVLRGRF